MQIPGPGTHLDHYIRQTRSNYMQLSYMADKKANMILTVSSIMIPLSLRYLTEPEFMWVAGTMIFFCIVTVITAALAAMPKVPLRTRRNAVTPDLSDPSYNILYFGNFCNLEYSDFVQAMEKIMNDHGRTYETQLREIYVTGQYLARKKYRFVRLAYLFFVSGLLMTLVVYVVQLIF